MQERESTTKKLNTLLTLLQYDPQVSIETQREALGGVTEETVKSYHDRLVKKNLAINHNPVLTPKASMVFPHFWVFVQTTYQPDRNGSATDGERPARILTHYQRELATEIKEEIAREFSDSIILTSIDIVLGCDWDMILSLQGKDVATVHSFVTASLRTQRHVLRTSTAWAIPSYAFQDPNDLEVDE